MKIKVNFKTDEPTVNGRIYPKEVLKKAFDERLEGSLFVTEKFDMEAVGVPVSDIIAEVKDYEITEKNEIIVDINPIRRKELLERNDIKLTTAGYASLKNNEKIVGDDFILTSLFIAMEDLE
jgi:hypothetical protein